LRRVLRLTAVVLSVLAVFYLVVLAFGLTGPLPVTDSLAQRAAYTGTLAGLLAGLTGSVLVLLLDREREAADLAEFEANATAGVPLTRLRRQHPSGKVLLRVGICLAVAGALAVVVEEYAFRKLAVPSPIWREYAAYALIGLGAFAIACLLLALRGRLTGAGADRAARLRTIGLVAALLLPAAAVAGAGVVVHLSYLDRQPDACLAGSWTVASRIGTFPGGGKNPPETYTGGGGTIRIGSDGKGDFGPGAESLTYRASQGDESFELRSELGLAFTYFTADARSISFRTTEVRGDEGRTGKLTRADPVNSTANAFAIGYDYVCFPDKLIFEKGAERIEFTRGAYI
jgi:hypothetical protein